MTFYRLAASSFVFLILVSVPRRGTFGFPWPLSWERNEEIDHVEIEDDGEPDPSELLASIHSPNDRAEAIHHFSRSLLRVTKDLLSYAPRSANAEYLDLQQKLAVLQSINPDDVNDLLSEQAIIIPAAHNVTCRYETHFYRTMDGSCNNLYNPCWGKADEPYQRWLPPAYANGVDEPRRRADGTPLPSPRQVYQWVSSQFEQTASTTYSSLSNLVVVWGQMVAHDLLLTPTVTIKVWDGKQFKSEKPKCCNTTTPHPDCIPIVMDYPDGYYSRGHCMDIVRSVAHAYSPFSCSPLKLGKTREQINQITTFLDASIVYGSSEEEMRKLRENGGYGAKLTLDYSSGWSHPVRKNSSCKSHRAHCDKHCFLLGERRANENPVLGAMHTLWAREHNRLVDILSSRGWSEETLFYVVRKIVGAMLQHITYKEYIPIVLGTGLSDLMHLTVPTQNYYYDPSINPTLYNVFMSAAFRYGHSMLSSRHKRAGGILSSSPVLSQDFFSVDDFCNPVGDPITTLLSGQLDQKVQKVDCLFSKQITNHLFAKNMNGQGLDLFSLNVQRGRDHGIPPYNKWREVCGLPKARDYSDLKGSMPDYVVERLEAVYGPGNVDEVDMFVGGISEYPANGGILGPTFTCIVSNQFKNLKYGDRFWYENLDHAGAFTRDQIMAIQKTTLASLICRNSAVGEIQEKAFVFESSSNPRLPCSLILQHTDIDLRLWP